MTPMLAEDADETKIHFPVILQPKIDGVRSVNFDGILTGRSLKKHRNKHVTELFSHKILEGLDGEMVAEHECHPNLCSITSSALGTIKGEPFVLWWLFDFVGYGLNDKCYEERYKNLTQYVKWLYSTCNEPFVSHLRVVPSEYCETMEALLWHEEQWLDSGYEGLILRSPDRKYKEGRSTVKEGGLLRIKRFVEEEAVVVAFEEGSSNTNVATINELGHTHRSSHKEGLIPKGQIGSLLCRALKNISSRDKVLILKDDTFTVSPGTMTAKQRKYFFENPNELLGKTIKFKFFPHGCKDKPRFPNFQSFIIESDK